MMPWRRVKSTHACSIDACVNTRACRTADGIQTHNLGRRQRRQRRCDDAAGMWLVSSVATSIGRWCRSAMAIMLYDIVRLFFVCRHRWLFGILWWSIYYTTFRGGASSEYNAHCTAHSRRADNSEAAAVVFVVAIVVVVVVDRRHRNGQRWKPDDKMLSWPAEKNASAFEWALFRCARERCKLKGVGGWLLSVVFVSLFEVLVMTARPGHWSVVKCEEDLRECDAWDIFVLGLRTRQKTYANVCGECMSSLFLPPSNSFIKDH